MYVCIYVCNYVSLYVCMYLLIVEQKHLALLQFKGENLFNNDILCELTWPLFSGSL